MITKPNKTRLERFHSEPGTLKAGVVKRIHIDKHVIRAGGAKPITIQTSAGSIKCSEASIRGVSDVEYQPDHPLKCGAKVWITTTNEVWYD